MKKKLTLSLLTLTVIILALVFLWPLSFSDVIANNAETQIVITDMSIENGAPNQDSAQYNVQPGSEEFEHIQQILNSYSFHRSFRSLFGGASIDGNDAGYWLHLYSNGKEIVCGGTGEIIVDSHVYRIGYLG